MTLIQELTTLLGKHAVLTDVQSQSPYLQEWRNRYTSECLAVVLPESNEQVAEVVRACGRHQVSIVPQGGNTGLCGGAVSGAGQVMLSLARLHARCDVDAANATITVDAGCTLAAVQNAAAEAELFFPVSIVPREQAQIGGLISTNAGGTNVLKYGNMRQQVLGLEVVLADGSVWDGLRCLYKDNSGYDLKQCLIGAEGTLGIVTAAVLRLYPRPAGRVAALIGVESIARASAMLSALRADFADVCGAEVFSAFAMELVLEHGGPDLRNPLAGNYEWYLLLEVEVFPGQGGAVNAAAVSGALQAAGLAPDAVIAVGDEAEIDALWALRKGIPAAQTAAGVSLKHDISVPLSRIPELVQRGGEIVERSVPGARPCVFGHLGDGNLHFNISQPVQGADELKAEEALIRRELHDLVQALGGSFAAEHGIGLLKTGELERYRSETEVALMRSIKKALDPDNLLNPGKVLAG